MPRRHSTLYLLLLVAWLHVLPPALPVGGGGPPPAGGDDEERRRAAESGVDGYMQSGMNHMKSGEPQAALEQFLRAARNLPPGSDLHGRVAGFAGKATNAIAAGKRRAGDVAGAVTLYSTVATDAMFSSNFAAPEQLMARHALAAMSHDSGDLAQAAEQYEAALALAPSDFKTRNKYNAVLASSGNLSGAVWHFGRACHPKVCGEGWARGLGPSVVRALLEQLHRPATGSSDGNGELATKGKGRRARQKKRLQARHHTPPLPPASEAEQAEFESGERPLSAWEGAVPREVLERLDLRPGGEYWRVTQRLVAASNREPNDAGFVSWWAPRSRLEHPQTLLEQVIGGYILPLLPAAARARVSGVESWGHTKESKNYGWSIPGHKPHFDLDTLRHSATGHIVFPLFTCLLFIDAGGGHGGATLVLDQSRDDEGPGAPAERAWVFAPRAGDVMCFNSTRNRRIVMLSRFVALPVSLTPKDHN